MTYPLLSIILLGTRTKRQTRRKTGTQMHTFSLPMWIVSGLFTEARRRRSLGDAYAEIESRGRD